MDRAGHLRTNQTTLDQMWQRAKIIHVADSRLAVEAGGTKLRYLTADHVQSLISSNEYKSGEKYFLGFLLNLQLLRDRHRLCYPLLQLC